MCKKKVSWSKKKYCSRKCFFKYRTEKYIRSWLAGEISGERGKSHDLSTVIRTYLIRQSGNKCSKCEWNTINLSTGLVPLTVNHINGNPEDHRPENLEVLCPNCHSLTPNYGGANRGNGRKQRRIKRNAGMV